MNDTHNIRSGCALISRPDSAYPPNNSGVIRTTISTTTYSTRRSSSDSRMTRIRGSIGHLLGGTSGSYTESVENGLTVIAGAYLETNVAMSESEMSPMKKMRNGVNSCVGVLHVKPRRKPRRPRH